MDEEFFFPQNVQTTYRLFGMGPRHIKRAVVGLPVVVLVAVLFAQAYVLAGVLAFTLLGGAYVAGCCWPVNGDETVIDLWLHVRRMHRQQTVFVKKEEVSDSGADRSDSGRHPSGGYRAGANYLDRTGVADESPPAQWS